MNLQDFLVSLAGPSPPAGVPPLLEALWHDRRGDWHRAHEIAQDVPGADGAWVHAYLHRREGDQSNAAYWYRQADRPVARGDLDEEWAAIAESFLV